MRSLLLLLLALLAPTQTLAELHVRYLDVGQGDATLLTAPGCAMLIDAGRHDRLDVVAHLRAAEVTSLDLLIGTHPHADHIGQFAQVLTAFSVREVWMSGWEHSTRTFERALDAILVSEAGYHEPRAGDVEHCGPLTVEVINPTAIMDNIHDGIALRVTYGSVRFMFTGDATAQVEEAMITRANALSADVLKLGHHGSHTSTGENFLAAVAPSVAVYSAVADSPYGHPHPSVIKRLLERGIAVYGTAVHGTLIVVSDGHSVRILTENGAPPEPGTHQLSSRVVAAELFRGDCVDLNTASVRELQRVVHIGPARAQAVVDGRPWGSIQELTRLRAIGNARKGDILAQNLACVE